MQTGPSIDIEEMRDLVLQGLRYFNSQSDHTTNYPDSKTISNLKKKDRKNDLSKIFK